MTNIRRGKLPKSRTKRKYLSHALIERERCLNSSAVNARVFLHLTFKEFAKRLLEEHPDIETRGIGVVAEGFPPRFERGVDKPSVDR
jgi:hypothetical protein